jgi:myo-inositol catabolism protein IolC
VITIGHPDPLFLFAFGDRDHPPLTAEHRAILWEALDRSLAQVELAPDEVGLLVGDEEPDLLAEVGTRELLRVVPVDRDDDRAFELAHGDDFARHLDGAGARIARARLCWNHGHPPADKKAQVLHLTKLAAWLHETDRELLIDLEVPSVEDDLALVEGDHDRFRAELHPALVRRAVQELRDLGVEPDLWLTEPPATVEDARALSDTVHEAGREDVALLVPDTAEGSFLHAAADLAGYGGFVAGRSLWAEPLAALDAARSSRDETVHAIDAAFRHRLDRFRSHRVG